MGITCPLHTHKKIFIQGEIFLQNPQKGFVKGPTTGLWPTCVFLFRNISLWMFFWRSAWTGNLSHSCRLQFLTRLWQPMASKAPGTHHQMQGGGIAPARAPGYGARTLLQLRFNAGHLGRAPDRAPSFTIECSGTPDLWKSSSSLQLPDWKQKSQGWRELEAVHRMLQAQPPHASLWLQLVKSIQQHYGLCHITRELQYCLHGAKGLADAREDAIYPSYTNHARGAAALKGQQRNPVFPQKGNPLCCHSAPRTATPGKIQEAKS